MTNPTSNFGWQMPEPTDLVTNLPADFEVFGQAVDTDFVDLLGGTTGQVLSKTSNTDLDFTWTSATAGDITGVTAGTGISGGGTSGTVTVTNDMATTITAAGDIVVGTGSGTYDNLPIGTTNQVLTADTSVSPYKVKWATPAGGSGGLVQIIPSSVSVGGGTATVGANGLVTVTSATTNISIQGVFDSVYTNYKIVFALEPGTSYTSLDMRLRNSAGSDNSDTNSYKLMGGSMTQPTAASGFNGQEISTNKFQTFGFIGSDSSTTGGEFILYRPYLAKATSMTSMVSGSAAGAWYFYWMGGSHITQSSFTGFSILTTQALTGTFTIYGWSE